jgi:aminoglycoside phosphotransferase (APT) family kinase protein
VEHKRQTYFKEKYDRPGLEDLVRPACRDALGDAPGEVVPLRTDGNHFAFRVAYPDRECLFRADDGTGDDDYLLAESRLMALAAGQGVPVPAVYHTDVTRARCPLRFQITAWCPDPCLHAHHKAGRLDIRAVSRQLGQSLRRLHAVRLDGFGFINTARLAASGDVRRLDARYADYFGKRLADHVGYLRGHGLLEAEACDEVLGLFRRHAPRLDLAQGVLVHRDAALWNILGTPDRITAIVDWDDAVSGDPADDLGILRCLYDDAFMEGVLQGYWGTAPVPPDFDCRVWMHTLRNMLWKTQIRHALGYFDKDRDFFLTPTDTDESLRTRTLRILRGALDRLRRCETP